MIKRLSFLALLVVPSFAFGQGTAPARPNHTLPQYSTATAARSNSGVTRSMLRMAPSSAVGGYAPLLPPGGMSKDTGVPSLYEDGSAGTLEQIGLMADGSVQQNDANQPHGYVQPDNNGAITLPVVGDATSASAMASGTNIRPVSSVPLSSLGNTDYLHNAGAAVVTGGVVNRDLAQAIINRAVAPLTLHAASGEYVPIVGGGMLSVSAPQINRIYFRSDGTLLSPSDSQNQYIGNPQWNGGHVSERVGDSVLTESFEPRFGIMRDRTFSNPAVYDTKNLTWPAGISSDYYKLNTTITIPSTCISDHGGDTTWCNPGSYEAAVHRTVAYNSSNAGLVIDNNYLEDNGVGYGGAHAMVHFNMLHDAGRNWTWINTDEHDEVGSYNIAGYQDPVTGQYIQPGLAHYINEWDYTGIGPEDPRSAYDPIDYGLRKVLWYNQWFNALSSWSSGLVSKQHALIGVYNPADGKSYMYSATVDGGVTGKTQPAFTFSESGLVPDGTQKWVFLGVKRYEVGCVLCFYPKWTQDSRMGAILAAKGNVYDAPIDFSQVFYTQPVHATYRTAADSYFDLSADGTKAGQNNHLLGYDSAGKALAYKVNGVPVFSVKDSGAIVSSAPAQMPVMTRAQIRSYPSPAKGMEIYDSDDDAPAIYTGAGWKLMALSALPTN